MLCEIHHSFQTIPFAGRWNKLRRAPRRNGITIKSHGIGRLSHRNFYARHEHRRSSLPAFPWDPLAFNGGPHMSPPAPPPPPVGLATPPPFLLSHYLSRLISLPSRLPSPHPSAFIFIFSLFLSYGGAPPNRWTPVLPVTRAASPGPMEGFRHQRSPRSDRFLGLLAPPLAANGTVVSAGEDELQEEDIFWTGADPPSSELNLSPMNPSLAAANPNPSPALPRAGLRHLPEQNFGILAALPEDDKQPPTPKTRPAFLQRKAAAAAVVSTSPSSASTSARMIPSVPKPKPEFVLSMPGGKIHHQSAPVNVPMAPPKARRGLGKLEMDDGYLDGDEEMLPPHEIVARRSRNGSPMTTFSVLEGVGRTLKGRDLRQVRNAVWRKTGFLD